ncbi:Os03g0715900 [Oryza sativa Japonica Group]|jgi:hypothetical protein|uniref:Os03g0715900 protein n=1 Tax=Oryza sativa subsp. japonica TaxID=39947 RepID=A0A0P0W2N1_ORYSJ|nr:hypothetical protein EE612_020055 [Oryza sativa]BAS86079.1 Os03g0715900 [Oryza sativa Japonica Group]
MWIGRLIYSESRRRNHTSLPPLARLHHRLSLLLLRGRSPRHPWPPAAADVFLVVLLFRRRHGGPGEELEEDVGVAYLLGVAAAMVGASYAPSRSTAASARPPATAAAPFPYRNNRCSGTDRTSIKVALILSIAWLHH